MHSQGDVQKKALARKSTESRGGGAVDLEAGGTWGWDAGGDARRVSNPLEIRHPQMLLGGISRGHIERAC